MNLAMQLLENELFGHVRERSSALSILGPAVLKPPTAAPCCSTNHPLDWWAGAELNCRHEDFQTCARVCHERYEKPPRATINGFSAIGAIVRAASGHHRRAKPPHFRHT
jgi:hypothetical protein